MWPHRRTFAFGVRPFQAKVVMEARGKNVISKGRVDAELSASDGKLSSAFGAETLERT
jgi:hypothetical protein